MNIRVNPDAYKTKTGEIIERVRVMAVRSDMVSPIRVKTGGPDLSNGDFNVGCSFDGVPESAFDDRKGTMFVVTNLPQRRGVLLELDDNLFEEIVTRFACKGLNSDSYNSFRWELGVFVELKNEAGSVLCSGSEILRGNNAGEWSPVIGFGQHGFNSRNLVIAPIPIVTCFWGDPRKLGVWRPQFYVESLREIANWNGDSMSIVVSLGACDTDVLRQATKVTSTLKLVPSRNR